MSPEDVPTPGMTTVEEVSGALGVPAGALIKALPVVVDEDAAWSSCSSAATTA